MGPRHAPQPNQGDSVVDMGSDDDSAGEDDGAEGGAARPPTAVLDGHMTDVVEEAADDE